VWCPVPTSRPGCPSPWLVMHPASSVNPCAPLHFWRLYAIRISRSTITSATHAEACRLYFAGPLTSATLYTPCPLGPGIGSRPPELGFHHSPSPVLRPLGCEIQLLAFVKSCSQSCRPTWIAWCFHHTSQLVLCRLTLRLSPPVWSWLSPESSLCLPDFCLVAPANLRWLSAANCGACASPLAGAFPCRWACTLRHFLAPPGNLRPVSAFNLLFPRVPYGPRGRKVHTDTWSALPKRSLSVASHRPAYAGGCGPADDRADKIGCHLRDN